MLKVGKTYHVDKPACPLLFKVECIVGDVVFMSLSSKNKDDKPGIVAKSYSVHQFDEYTEYVPPRWKALLWSDPKQKIVPNLSTEWFDSEDAVNEKWNGNPHFNKAVRID